MCNFFCVNYWKTTRFKSRCGSLISKLGLKYKIPHLRQTPEWTVLKSMDWKGNSNLSSPNVMASKEPGAHNSWQLTVGVYLGRSQKKIAMVQVTDLRARVRTTFAGVTQLMLKRITKRTWRSTRLYRNNYTLM